MVLPGTSGSGFLFQDGFGFDPGVTPVGSELPEPVVELPEPVVELPDPVVDRCVIDLLDLLVDFACFALLVPAAETSLLVPTVAPGLLALDEGVWAEAAVTPRKSVAAAMAVITFIRSLRGKIWWWKVALQCERVQGAARSGNLKFHRLNAKTIL